MDGFEYCLCNFKNNFDDEFCIFSRYSYIYISPLIIIYQSAVECVAYMIDLAYHMQESYTRVF